MQKLNNNVLNEDYVFIKGFFKITLTDICKRLNISITYLTAGGYTEDVYRKVKKDRPYKNNNFHNRLSRCRHACGISHNQKIQSVHLYTFVCGGCRVQRDRPCKEAQKRVQIRTLQPRYKGDFKAV